MTIPGRYGTKVVRYLEDGDTVEDAELYNGALIQPVLDDGEYGINFLCDEWSWDCDDCDGLTDEPDAQDAIYWYADADGDGFGDGNGKEFYHAFINENTIRIG